MRTLPPVDYGSLFFAPMEGITDEAFRKTILKLYPEWDYLATDFLRVPSAGKYPLKHLIRHFGKDLFEVPWVKEKTQFQILTSHRAFTSELVQDLENLQIPWLDLNLGCPSNTVTGNGGGSSLLKDLASLRPLVRKIRDGFKGRFTAKVRLGFNDTKTFEDIIRLLNDEGVEMITVHCRTRAQMYKEPANWEFLPRAVQISQVPIIGNGDVWKTEDITRMLRDTGVHGVMVARGALKTPWMAQDYRKEIPETSLRRIEKIKTFFREYRAELETETVSDRGLLKQSKSVVRFMTDGLENGEQIRRSLLLSQTTPEFYAIVENL
jgi:tRNA-dihydrouridine synthase